MSDPGSEPASKPEPEYRVIPFTADRMDAVQGLWREAYSEEEIERRTRIFEWFALGNPFLEGQSSYYLLLDGDRVVGMHGEAPCRYSVRGERLRGTIAFDDRLSVDYRGRGLGKVMLDGAAELNQVLRVSLWHNEPNRRLYGKAGWLDFDDFFPYRKIFDPTALLRGRLGRIGARAVGRPASWLLRLREFLRRRPTSDLRLEEIERFDPEFDAFFDRVAPRFDALVVRDAAYLNWKFVGKPGGGFTFLAAHDTDGLLVGYAIASCAGDGEDAVGSIVDLLADPDTQAFAALVERCTDLMRARGVASIRIACTYPAFIDVLQQLGFARGRRRLGFMIHGWEGRIDPSFSKSAQPWYLTYGDADGLVWAAQDDAG